MELQVFVDTEKSMNLEKDIDPTLSLFRGGYTPTPIHQKKNGLKLRVESKTISIASKTYHIKPCHIDYSRDLRGRENRFKGSLATAQPQPPLLRLLTAAPAHAAQLDARESLARTPAALHTPNQYATNGLLRTGKEAKCTASALEGEAG